MATRYHRAQILLDPEQHRELTEIARRQRRSVSDVVREYLGERLANERQVAEVERRRRAENWQRILEFREQIIRQNGGKPLDVDWTEVIRKNRDERDAQIVGEPNPW